MLKIHSYKLFFILALLVGIGTLTFLAFHHEQLPANDDSYRHIKTAYLYRTLGNETVNQFPWLPFSFNAAQADLWLLFHIVLIPFSLDNLLLGAKLATVILGAIVIVLFLLNLPKGKWSRLVWTLLLISGSTYFTYRLLLPRAWLLNLIFLLGLVLALRSKRAWIGLPIGILFALNNPAVPVVLLVTGLWDLLNMLYYRHWLPKATLWAGLGILVGLRVHPAFPDNIELLLTQLLIFKYQGFTSMVELASIPLTQFFKLQLPILLVWLSGLGYYMYASIVRKQKDVWQQENVWLGIVSILLCAAALRHQRFVEYWVPFALLYVASLQVPIIAALRSRLRLQARRWGALIVVLAMGAGLIYNMRAVNANVRSAPSASLFQGSATWLREHSKQNDIVFNTGWDQFSQLLFWNHYNRYVIGIDPVFMYQYNYHLYRSWRTITSEHTASWNQDTVYRPLVKDFKAHYIFIENERTPLLLSYLYTEATVSKTFVPVYWDNSITIFEIK